jgi:hypothetical protein
MKIIIYILLFLLVISIANNYILHYYQSEDNIKLPDQSITYLVEPSKLPENIGIMSLYIFYDKDTKYNKCHEMDKLENSDSSDKSAMLINIKKIISDIYNKNDNKCFIIKRNNNEKINLNEYLEKAIKKIA